MPDLKHRKACPICGKPQEQMFRPFCSKRCADVDLARWLKGHYAIPAQSDPDDEDECILTEESDEETSGPH